MFPRNPFIWPVAILALANASAAAHGAGKPRLVVQVTVDQLRGDLIERYRPAFTAGLKRILDQGWWFPEARVDHAVTLSFPGHATLATGRTPTNHGLTANEWWQPKDGKWKPVDVVADERYRVVGHDGSPSVSPDNLRATTLADWVKAADPGAKVVALSNGPTIALAYGGRRPDAAYWYDGAAGGFVTSAYYEPRLRPWVVDFQRRDLPAFQRRRWGLVVAEGFRALARPDASAHEAGGKNNVFPHDYAVESRAAAGRQPTSYGRWFAGTGLKDAPLFALAKRAVDAERLGQRGRTDYLAVSADGPDSVGHRFGPNSLEQLDTLVRLDRALGDFLDHLDRAVGSTGYVLALSADHGVADPPEEGRGRRVRAPEIEALLDRVEAIAIAHRGSRAELAEKMADELRRADFIADAYTEERLAAPRRDEDFAELYKKAFSPGRTTDFPLWSSRDRVHHPARYGVVARFRQDFVFDYAPGVHGSPYDYDRRVPIVFYGGGVAPCRASEQARTIDVAPTLAALAGVPVPNPIDGRPLSQPATCSPNP